MKIQLTSKEVVERIANQLMDECRIPEGVAVNAVWKVSLPAPGADTGDISLTIEVEDSENG